MDWVPGINPSLIGQARASLEQWGMFALFSGAASGIPYKLYAVQAASVPGADLAMFMLFSACARLGRFLLATSLTWWAGVTLRRFAISTRLHIHAVVWIAFYIFYFWRMGF